MTTYDLFWVVFKITARDQGHYKGPLGAFVTYCNISFFFFGGGGGGGGGVRCLGGYEHESCHILYTRHTVTTSTTELYSLMILFLMVFKIMGIVALAIKGR